MSRYPFVAKHMTVSTPPILTPERIKFKKRVESQKRAIDILTDLLVQGQREISKNQVFDALINREKLGKTCIGKGISIPRAKLDITQARAAVLVLKKGLHANTVDKEPLSFFLAILIPSDNDNNLTIDLKALNSTLISDNNLEKIIATKNPKRLIEFIEPLLSKEKS